LPPVDLIPDFIPVLGYLDDLIILPLLTALSIKCIPDDVMGICIAEAKGIWKDGNPKKWYFAIPIILFWILLVLIIVLKIS